MSDSSRLYNFKKIIIHKTAKTYLNFIYFCVNTPFPTSKCITRTTIPNGMSFKIEFFERTMKRTIPFENEWLRWENDMKVNLNRVEVKATLKLFHSFLVRDFESYIKRL